MTACAGKFAKATVAEDGRSVAVVTSATGWGQGGSAESFLSSTRREMGKRALCIHVAGRVRALETVRMKHVLAESSTVSALDRDVKDWSKARFGGGSQEADALHDAVFDAFAVRSKNEALEAVTVGDP